jgi:hypothetical protein
MGAGVRGGILDKLFADAPAANLDHASKQLLSEIM